jgi:hypothetical protein
MEAKGTISLDFRDRLDPSLTILPSANIFTIKIPKKTENVKKPCPKGTRKNRKTGICEPYTKKAAVQEPLQEPAAAVPIAQASEEEPVPTAQETKVKRCPQGTRKNPKTGACESKTRKVTDAKAPRESKKESKKEAAPPTEKKQIIPTEFLEPEKNAELFEKEQREHASEFSETYDFLYPSLDDPNFNPKLAAFKEFADTQYDGTIYDIQKQADILCNAKFELLPHQLFVKNFLSLQTPYNSLLLYHGLGSGKTCSAIGIAEEMRSYMKQLNITQRILVVASPNVQSNFRLQLFDDRKLKLVSGSESAGDAIWNIESCIGNSLLKEINPTNLKGLTREKVSTSIKRIINQYYMFLGYGQLTNFIFSAIKKTADIENITKPQRKKLIVKHMRELFDNRLVIIDEVHNIRLSDDNKETKKTAMLLMRVVKYAQNMRLLLLSATPLFNSYKEIIWLTNLMNLNDKRSTIDINDIFDADGFFKEGGRELLTRKLTGYISYVRGENPYTFPYRIYPKDFAPEKTFQNAPYPRTQMNSGVIDEPIKHLNLYLSNVGEYQRKGYDKIIDLLKNKSYGTYSETGQMRRMPTFENMESFGYTVLQHPLEALNMVYPSELLEEGEEGDEDIIIESIVGKSGLNKIMKYVEETQNYQPLRYDFEYRPEVLETYGAIFSESEIGKYSAKIAEICSILRNSTGIVAIYSQYIDGGIVPLALALEEMGFGRYSSSPVVKNLFKTPPKSMAAAERPKYVMITGDKALSPNNAADIKYVTNSENKNGEKVRVILLSKAGAEGLDFKNIRQIHVLEPWYNMNRVEQIIGRAVRNFSHCALPFAERNVEIYLHGSILPGTDGGEEAADLYVYRLAERKALQIGNVTRLMKTIAVDCILNIGQTNFTVEKLVEMAANQNIELMLSTGNKKIQYKIGDRPFTEICDYMDNCNFVCSPGPSGKPEKTENYTTTYLQSNQEIIMSRVRELFREKASSSSQLVLSNVFYERNQLIGAINIVKPYPLEQIFSALSRFIRNKNEYLVDAYGRSGRLVDKYDAETDTAYYVFQPVEISDENASIYERSAPVDYNRPAIALEIDKSRPIMQVAVPTVPSATVTAVGPTVTAVAVGPTVHIQAQMSDKTFASILEQLKQNLATVFHTTTLSKGEKDWYKHAGFIVHYSKPENAYTDVQKIKNPDKTITAKTRTIELPITQLRKDFHITDEMIREYMIHHFLETLMFADKMVLISHFYSDNEDNEDPVNDLEVAVKTYLDKNILQVDEHIGMAIIKDETLIVIVKNEETNTWVEADQEDYELMGKELLLKNRIPRTAEKMNSLLGFITLFTSKKSNAKEMVFKVKDMTEKRNNFGARIDDAGKDKVIKLLNRIVDVPNYYNDDNTEAISQLGLCITIEIVMRAFSAEPSMMNNGKYYYVKPEQTVISEIIKKSFD